MITMNAMKQKSEAVISPSHKRSKSFQKDFDHLFSLDIVQLEKLKPIVETDGGFSIPDDSIATYASELNIEANIFERIISLLQHLYSRAILNDVELPALLDEIIEYAGTQNIKDLNLKSPYIEKLLTPKKGYDYKIKKEQAETSVNPLLTSFVIEFDVRAITGRNDELLGFSPLASVSIRTTHPPSSEETPFTFLMKEEHIDELLEYFTRAKKILSDLNKRFAVDKSKE